MAHAAQARQRFSILALALGALYAFVAPPLMARDEVRHLLRARELGQGRLISRSDERGTYYEAPAGFAQLSLDYDSLATDVARRLEVSTLLAALRGSTTQDSTRVESLIDTRSPLAYAPLLPGAWLASALDLSPLLSLYVERLSGLAVYVWLVGLSIVWVEQLAWLWLALALSPALLMQAAACSPDSFTTALSLLFFALIMRGARLKEEGLSASERRTLLALFVALCLCAAQNLVFGLALFACKWPRSERARVRLSAPVVAVLTASLLVATWQLVRYPSPAALVRELIPLSDWMLEHPRQVAATWRRTLFKRVSDYAIEVAAGSGPFVEDFRLVAGLVTAFQFQLVAMLALGALPAKRLLADGPPRREWLFLAASSAAYIVGCLAFYQALGNTNRPTWPIFQLPGSAFIPLLPALLGSLTMFGRPVATRWLVKRGGYRVLALATALNLLSVLVLVGRFYAAADPDWPY